MNSPTLPRIDVTHHLIELAGHIGPRPTGSPGNWRAGEYIRAQFDRFGWQVETQWFDCLTWENGGTRLHHGGRALPVQTNPYSLPFEGCFPFVVCDSVSALERHVDLRGQIVLLMGELAAEPYMPKNFPFFAIDEQLRVLRLLGDAQPEAIVAVHDGPLFCDPDLHLPSVTVTGDTARVIMAQPDQPIDLSIRSSSIPSRGFNVVARSGAVTDARVVICAHYDTWFNTPGAMDNATGVAVLLGLAETLDRRLSVEIVAFNGEDHYASPGQVTYLEQRDYGIDYVINIDGVGVAGRQNSVSFWGDAPGLFATVRGIQQDFPGVVDVEPWPQGDHMIFVQSGIPAVALSSVFDDWLDRTHTPEDDLTQVDATQVSEVIAFVWRLLMG